MGAQDQHRQIRARALQLSQCVDTVLARHRNVQEHHIALFRPDERQRLHAVRGFAGNDHVLLERNELLQTRTHDGVIIGDEDSDYGRRRAFGLFLYRRRAVLLRGTAVVRGDLGRAPGCDNRYLGRRCSGCRVHRGTSRFGLGKVGLAVACRLGLSAVFGEAVISWRTPRPNPISQTPISLSDVVLPVAIWQRCWMPSSYLLIEVRARQISTAPRRPPPPSRTSTTASACASAP